MLRMTTRTPKELSSQRRFFFVGSNGKKKVCASFSGFLTFWQLAGCSRDGSRIGVWVAVLLRSLKKKRTGLFKSGKDASLARSDTSFRSSEYLSHYRVSQSERDDCVYKFQYLHREAESKGDFRFQFEYIHIIFLRCDRPHRESQRR